MERRLITTMLLAFALAALLAGAAGAQAATTSVFGGDVPCSTQPSGIRLCSGPTHTVDGTKIDVNVFLPPASGGDGPYPTIGYVHGWGGSKLSDSRTTDWAQRG